MQITESFSCCMSLGWTVSCPWPPMGVRRARAVLGFMFLLSQLLSALAIQQDSKFLMWEQQEKEREGTPSSPGSTPHQATHHGAGWYIRCQDGTQQWAFESQLSARKWEPKPMQIWLQIARLEEKALKVPKKLKNCPQRNSFIVMMSKCAGKEGFCLAACSQHWSEVGPSKSGGCVPRPVRRIHSHSSEHPFGVNSSHSQLGDSVAANITMVGGPSSSLHCWDQSRRTKDMRF